MARGWPPPAESDPQAFEGYDPPTPAWLFFALAGTFALAAIVLPIVTSIRW